MLWALEGSARSSSAQPWLHPELGMIPRIWDPAQTQQKSHPESGAQTLLEPWQPGQCPEPSGKNFSVISSLISNLSHLFIPFPQLLVTQSTDQSPLSLLSRLDKPNPLSCSSCSPFPIPESLLWPLSNSSAPFFSCPK